MNQSGYCQNIKGVDLRWMLGNRNEEGENNPSPCRFQELMYQEARKGKEPVREERRLEPTFFKFDSPGAFTG